MKCPICNKDLSKEIKLGGTEIYYFHQILHLRNENDALRKGLEYLKDGGFGCQKEAQQILNEAKMA